MEPPTICPDPMLSLQQAGFAYRGSEPLFTAVTFALARGEMAGLLGPNGAGKTSLLRLACGSVHPTTGEVRLAGIPLHQLSRRQIARQIAVVPQEMTVPFAYTVRQIVEMGRTPHLHLLNWGALDQRGKGAVARALELTSTDTLADRLYNELSGGERQRVLLALALAQEPDILLLDEPTAHLDIRFQIEILELIARLNRENGLTILASLHDLNLAARFFPRLILFQRGIIADGAPSQTLTPELIKQVYGVQVQVGILRGTRHFSIAPPVDASSENSALLHPAVHVIAGGGTGDLAMRALAERAIPFTAGALNIGDSDTALAEHLAQSVITEPPFAPVSPLSRQATVAALVLAGQGILCPIPVGPGNLPLLEAAREAQMLGCRLWLFEPLSRPDDSPTTGIHTRDYTEGRATALYHDLIEHGAIRCTDAAMLCDRIAAPVAHEAGV